jgi:choline dehydrogenase-like flavoprotein
VILDARQLPRDTVIDADVCIVGAGAAGITLAREFIGQPFKVCLIESGGLDFDEKTQSLYEGKLVGLPDHALDIARLRYFGGATNHWGGSSRPFDPQDFQVRPWIPYSGWPITRADLDTFYERAQHVIEIGDVTWDVASHEDEIPAFYRLPFMGRRLAPAIWHKSPPTRFGRLYRDELIRAPNISTYLHANVTDIETNDAASVATRLRVACLDGNRFWVGAKLYVLALGAIENSRTLLLANKVQVAGLGNGHDLVGRFYMNHPQMDAGLILLSTPDDLTATPASALGKTTAHLTLAEECVEKERISRFRGNLYPADLTGKWERGKGYRSLASIVRRLRNAELPHDFLTDVGNIIQDLDGLVMDLANKYRAMPGIVINTEYEQVPNPDSRVFLGPERDALGLNRVNLDWRLTSLDKYSLRRSMEIIGEELGRAGVGRLRIDDWVLSDDLSSFPGTGAWHHAGGTRMSADPKTGVVDKDCRMHGVANLYIAGGSVFPTGGIANPTLTIVALAIRLADHVKALMA